jgi:hypothetical protein
MTTETELELDGCLVIFEGAPRLRWRRLDAGRWRMTGLWPDADQRRRVHARIDAGLPTLVVLGAQDSVPVLREECADMPAGPDPVDITVPVLDWLPGPHRRRGLDFLATSTRVVATRPRLLLPALLLDDVPDPLRFALRTTEQPLWPLHLRRVVDHAFGDTVLTEDLDQRMEQTA